MVMLPQWVGLFHLFMALLIPGLHVGAFQRGHVRVSSNEARSEPIASKTRHCRIKTTGLVREQDRNAFLSRRNNVPSRCWTAMKSQSLGSTEDESFIDPGHRDLCQQCDDIIATSSTPSRPFALMQKSVVKMSNLSSDRRSVFQGLFLGMTTVALSGQGAQPATARGLVQFPCVTPMANSYHFMRAGTTLLEEEGMWSTNPLFLTNREDALSVAGQEQVVEACQLLQLGNRPPTLVKYSLAAGSMDTANCVARELKLGRERLVPEFTFLDPRAIGAWDMSARDVASPAVWAMDNDEAGVDGLNGRPPPNEDGTPHEVLADQAIRLRQIMSILESQYSGDTILLIFPDGTGPALLSAMVAGIPYNRAHELEYKPGEVRFDVTRDSTLALWKTKQQQEGTEYQAILRRGRENLNQLRTTASNGGSVVNLKDQKQEEERQTIEAAWREKEQRRIRTEQTERDERLLRVREVQAANPSNDFGVLMGGSAVAGGAAILLGGGTSDPNGSERALANESNATGETGSQDGPVLAMATSDGLYASVGSDGSTMQSGRSVVRYSPGGGAPRVRPAVVINRREAADRAMEDYLNQDDGADDWLTSLSQIIDDPSEAQSEVTDDTQPTLDVDPQVDTTTDIQTNDVSELIGDSAATSDTDTDWAALSSSPDTLSAWGNDTDSFQ